MSDDSSQSLVSKAGRGVLWLTLAKFYFMGTGFLLLVFLPAMFTKLSGDVDGSLYGRFRVVIGLINLLNMILIGGALQAVSKFISEKETRARAVKWQALRIQIVLGGVISVGLFTSADYIAQRFYGQPELAFYLRLASPIVLLYACYAVIIGCLNGLKRFFHQALMDVLFASSKVGLTILLVAGGFAIAGAIGGFLATAVSMLLIATLVLGRLPAGDDFSWRTILAFEWKTLLYALGLNIVLQLDLQLLMALAPPEFGSAESQTGIYGLALQMGQLPYIATIAVAFVVFPLVSRSTFDNDARQTKTYVVTTNRFLFVALAGIVAALSTTGNGIMSLPFFPDFYASGSQIFSVLTVGYLFFAIIVVNTNILTGSGRPLTSVALLASTTSLAALFNLYAIPRYGGIGAAAATSAAMGCGYIATFLVCRRRFGAFISPLTLGRSALGATVVVLYHHYLEPSPTGLVSVLLSLIVKSVLYFAVLVALRELTRTDLHQVLLLRRRK
jgi:O-antigen/teichoic acid export membrane protein